MPIYEFLCRECGHVDEYLVFGSGEGESCKKCGSGKLEKMMSSFSFRSSGGGKVAAGSGCAGCTRSNCSTCA